MLQRCGQQELRLKKQIKIRHKIQYDTYLFSKKEWVIYGLQSLLITGLLGYFFYGSFIWVIILTPLVPVLLKRKQGELCKTRKQNLLNQFKEMLVSLNNAIQAGYSLENAITETYKDMEYFYKEDSLILRELAFIRAGIRNGQSPESLLVDLGERSQMEDIMDFAHILTIGKKSGGNMPEIIKAGISVMEEKIETKQRIQTLLSAKKLESKIMSVIPFFIILYIETTSKGYFDALYQTWGGHIFMTLCLTVYLIAVAISEKITEIEI